MELKKKKIAVLCNYELLPNRIGGMDYFFWSFDQQCKANNWDIDWYFPNESRHGQYHDFTIFSSDYKPIENFFINQNTNSYHYIFTHFIELCTPFFYKLKQLSAAKVIVVDHNPRPLNGYSFKKKIEKRVKGILYSKYIDVFVGVSNYTVTCLLKDFGNHLKPKMITIYNGVIIDTILQRNERQILSPSFLVVSHLRESKGIQDLIEAVKLLPDDIKNEIKIDIYGEGPLREFLLAKIKEYRLGLNFNFMGSQSSLNTIYCHYDYLVQPTHMECFSLSILESLAANVPVITTSVGGNEEVVTNGKNGFIFKAEDAFTLSKILQEVFLGQKKITTNTRKLIIDFYSLEKMTSNYYQLLS